METKSEIRKRVIDERNALDIQVIAEKSASVCEKLCSLEQYARAGMILAYMSYRNEVSTDLFIKRCLRDGKRVAVPKVVQGSGRELELYEIRDVKRDIKPGFKGIPEPDITTALRAAPSDIDMAVIPGVSFDKSRFRVGYGAGYYDRFLGKLRADCIKVGVAFEIQLVDNVCADTHDVPMDMIITESRFI